MASQRIARLLLTTTLTLAEIGEACGVSRQRVHQVWNALNIAATPQRPIA